MLKGKSVAFRLTILIILCSMIVFAIQFTYFYIDSRKITINSVEQIAKNMSESTVNKIETILKSTMKITTSYQSFIESGRLSDSNIRTYIKSIVENNIEIFGSTISFEPYMFDSTIKFYGPYYYKNNKQIKYENLANESYNYLNWGWYKEPKELNKPVWSEPYFDEGAGNIVMSTYSNPLYKTTEQGKKFIGVATCDISLDSLNGILKSLEI